MIDFYALENGKLERTSLGDYVALKDVSDYIRGFADSGRDHNGYNCCPVCFEHPEKGHKTDCPLSNMLERLGKKGL